MTVMTWLKLAWANRARIIDVARKLKWSRRTLALAVVAGAVYAVATYGYRINPNLWTPAQWAQLLVNLAGLFVLFIAQHIWWNRQDQVWDEVDQLRTELDGLRESLHRAPTAELQTVPSDTVQREVGGRMFSFKG